MVIAQSAPQPTEESPTNGVSGGGGGGGGGGITSEADEIVLIDSGNSDTSFIRRFVKDDDGLITGTVDVELDGTTAYAATGPVTYPGDPADFPGLTTTNFRNVQSVVMVDQGNSNTPFIRTTRWNPSSLSPLSAEDHELDGTTSYAPTGPVVPSGLQPVGSAASFGLVNVTYQRLANASVTVAAGSLSVQYLVIADGVTVDTVAVPAGAAVTHEVTGGVINSIDFVADATGDVLIIVESAA